MDEVFQNHTEALNSNVNKFRDNNSFCDVEINVEGSVFKCHRNILAASCEYFRCMFCGKFAESTTSEVTLVDAVDPQTFEDTLRFIYTGRISINETNLYNLVRASDFFKLQYMEELCFQYIIKNLDSALVQNGLEIFSYTRATGKTTINEIICEYICKNFDYFSKTPGFLTMPFEDFFVVLCSTTVKAFFVQDVFVYAIMRWIRHNERSPRDRKSHFYEFIKQIDFAKISSNCVEYLTRIHFEDFNAASEHNMANHEITQPCLRAIDSEVMKDVIDSSDLQHVFVNSYSEDMSEFVTSIFTFYKQMTGYLWVKSFQYDCTDSYTFMRTVVLDGLIYCLSFFGPTSPAGKRQTFKTSSSISLFSNSYLKPPPLILKHYDLCGYDKHIYVYNRNTSSDITPRDSADTSFNSEQLSRGIYLYNREVDTWLSLPPRKRVFANACMTCDEKMVYLIGGTNSDKYVQGYDHRSSEWLSLSPTKCVFEKAACCVNGSEMYVSGGCQNPKSMEMYDPVAGKWQDMEPMKYCRSNHRIEPLWCSKNVLITAGKTLSQESPAEIYFKKDDRWKLFRSSLYDSIAMASDLKFKKHLKVVVDMTTYKPYGL